MKQFFEEPKVNLEQFAVIDQTLTVSWMPGLEDDETNPVFPISGPAIG